MERDIASLHSWPQGRLAEMNKVSPSSVMLANRSIELAHGSSLSMSKDGHRERRRLGGGGRGPQGCVPSHGALEMREMAMNTGALEGPKV